MKRSVTRRPVLRSLRAVAAVVVGCVVLSGCQFDVYKLPLPGGTDTGDDPMTLTVQFEDVLDLVPKTSVRVDEVSVGQVTAISLDGQVAEVTLEVRGDVDLPADAVAEIRQTSLLGEKFVELSAPETSSVLAGSLESGDTIGLDRSGRNPEVEEVLGALSLVLNGGGVAQLRTITRELNLALEGREDSVKSVLNQIDIFTTQLAENRVDIVDAIESLNQLAISAREQQPSINAALEELPSSLDSLDRQREDLVAMLQALNRLGDVGVDVIRRSKGTTIRTLELLQPVLTELANSGDDFVDAFNVFLTFPFIDEVVGRDPQVARNLHPGDYTNLSVQLDLDLNNLPDLPGLPCFELDAIPTGGLPSLSRLCEDAQAIVADCLNDAKNNLGTLPPSCLDIPGNVINLACTTINLPIPLLCPRAGGNGGGGGGGGGGLGLGGLDLGGLLGGDGGLLSGLLGRVPVGAQDEPAPTTPKGSGPTMADLSASYDPALVSLLTPGMVLR